jgi:hypothetical protein
MSRRFAMLACVLLLPIVVFAVWDYVAARRLSSAIEAIRVSGDPLLAETSRHRPDSDAQKEASRLYVAAGILVQGEWIKRSKQIDTAIRGIAHQDSASAARDPRLGELARLEEQYRPFFELLDRAAVLDARGLSYGDEPNHSLVDRSYIDMNAVRVLRLAVQGRSAEAARAIEATLAVGRISTHLMKMGMNTNRELELLLTFAPPAPADLQRLQRAYADFRIGDDVPRELKAERARFISMVWPAAVSTPAFVPRVRAVGSGQSHFFALLQQPLNSVRVRQALTTFELAIEPARQPWPAKLDAVSAFVGRYPSARVSGTLEGGLKRYFRDLVPAMWPVQTIAVEALGSATRTAAREITWKGLGTTAIAIERFRRDHASAPPSSLVDLVPGYLSANTIDPFSGEPFRYLKKANSYVVYSIGANRVDDGGDATPVSPPNRTGVATTPSKDITIEVRFRP